MFRKGDKALMLLVAGGLALMGMVALLVIMPNVESAGTVARVPLYKLMAFITALAI